MKLYLLLITVIISYSGLFAGTNNLLFSEYFSGDTGNIPQNWKVYTKHAGAFISDEFNFKQSKYVLRFPAKNKIVAVNRNFSELPRDGSLTFSIWARAVNSSGKIKLYLIGDHYNWQKSKNFILNDTWQKLTISAQVPDTYKVNNRFYCRIDAMKGSDIIVGKSELTFKSSKTVDKDGNLVSNADFSFGAWMWSSGFFETASLNVADEPQVFKDGILTMSPGVILKCFNFPLLPNTDYTALLRMKNAIPGKVSQIRCFLIDYEWKFITKTFTLSDEWQNYNFVGKLPHNRMGYAYLRLDAKNNPVAIDKVQVTKGIVKQFIATPEMEIGLIGPNNFDAGDSGATITLCALMTNPAPQIARVIIHDAFGSKVMEKSLKLTAEAKQYIRLRINKSGERGVFLGKIICGDYENEFRYTILKNLNKAALPDNPFAAYHFMQFQLFERGSERVTANFSKYTPVGTNPNRFFGPKADITECFQNPALQKLLRDSKAKNIMTLPHDEVCKELGNNDLRSCK